MTATWQSAADALVADLQRVFGKRLRSAVAYGPRLDGLEGTPLNCLVLVETFGMSDLEECSHLSDGWTRTGLATPLILAEQEFLRSLDAFPLEYGEILRAHQPLFGTDPFQEASISDADLRRACEAQVKSHLLHLREGYMEAGGQPQKIAALVSASAPAFAALLRNVARLSGSDAPERAEATREGARIAALPDGLVADILALERTPAIPTADAARLFPEYLATVEELAARIDYWRT